MNIKNISPSPVLPIEPRARVDGGVRTEASADRDANGKRESAQEEGKKKLSDSEFEEAMAKLKAMPGFCTNDLMVRVEMVLGSRMILIEDAEGRVVKRLTEGQLWIATQDKDRPTGNILDKAA